MLRKEENSRTQKEEFCVEDFVPKDHLLRKIEEAVNFNYIYELVKELYCENNGRPGIAPVVLFKMVLIQHLYGITSLRRTVEEISMNVAYRWFLGYSMGEKMPHFATISYNFRHRFTEEVTEQIFDWMLRTIAEYGYLSPEAVFIDGMHMKANASLKKKIKKEVPKAAKRYEQELRKEINEDREKHGKKPFSDDDQKPPKTKETTESTTDPECGVFHKGEHRKCFAYTAQTACDKYGYILDFTLNSGDVHDSVAFDELYARLKETFPEMHYAVMDSGFKTPWICKQVLDHIPVLPYKRPMGKEGFFRPYEYVYDEYYDCVICPENYVLPYSTTDREGYRQFKSKSYHCEKCPSRSQCTESKKYQKVVTKHVWSDYLEQAEDIRHTTGMKELYALRKETIERVFADAKEKHAMRYTLYRGLSQNRKWIRLKFAVMNLKKFAIHRWNDLHTSLIAFRFCRFYSLSFLSV